MKFKVGDKVKFIKQIHSHSSAVSVGNIYTINYVDEGTSIFYRTEDFEWFKEEELELAQLRPFTKSDLKDGDIVTYRNGEKRTKIAGKLFDENGSPAMWLHSYDEDLTREYKERKETDIVKVERPTGYETVFERKENTR